MNGTDVLPFGVVTVTLTFPVPAGLVAVIVVSLTTVTLLAAVPPNETLVEPTMKPVPIIVTSVPPAAGPLVGLIPDIVGAGGTTVRVRRLLEQLHVVSSGWNVIVPIFW